MRKYLRVVIKVFWLNKILNKKTPVRGVIAAVSRSKIPKPVVIILNLPPGFFEFLTFR